MSNIRDVDFTQSVIVRWIAIAMLVGAVIFPWPYGYYMILRWVVTFTAGWLLVLIWQIQTNWKWVFGAIAVLFNPIVPIHLSRSAWAVFDIVAAVLLAVSTRPISNRLHATPGRSGVRS